jgi:glycine/D-amino acid oxidase-like deaminating enzyme
VVGPAPRAGESARGRAAADRHDPHQRKAADHHRQSFRPRVGLEDGQALVPPGSRNPERGSDARGLIDEHGDPIDPDADERIPDRAAVERARAWLARRVPTLANAPVVETRVCAYENTATGDFLIDRHPGHDNVWIAGGGSGHGFKHGPAVGELMARMVLDGESPDPRFALAGKTIDERRSVY